MVNFAALMRDHWVNIFVPLGFVIGIYMDRAQDQKLTAFRNKSALYSRELKPGSLQRFCSVNKPFLKQQLGQGHLEESTELHLRKLQCRPKH
ncbi:unnamed protein product [Coregonus sp. 'balchen']|nr:unnamed protein product [Coregonus sp. 'balchen']